MAPKNKKGDNFTWVQNKGTNAWTRDFTRPYKEKKEEPKKAAPKKKAPAKKSGATKSSSRPKSRFDAVKEKVGKKPTRPKSRPKKASDTAKSVMTPKVTTKTLPGIGADMPTQQSRGPSSRGGARRKSKLDLPDMNKKMGLRREEPKGGKSQGKQIRNKVKKAGKWVWSRMKGRN